MPPKKQKSSSNTTSDNKSNKGHKGRSIFSRGKENAPMDTTNKNVKSFKANEPNSEDNSANNKEQAESVIVVASSGERSIDVTKTNSNVDLGDHNNEQAHTQIPMPEIPTPETTAQDNTIVDTNQPSQSASSSSVSIRFDDESLSTNVTRLTTANGSEVYLVGTAHFSTQSVLEVQKLIRAVKPTSVALELCGERAFMLSFDEESLLEQNRKLTFDKFRKVIAEKGLAQGLIFIMFIKLSANLTEKLGVAPGVEFRAGSAEAQKIPGCRVVLADRPLRITVARAVASVTLWQKLKLVYHVLVNDLSITEDDIEKCKDKDILEQLLQELGGQFPGFKRVILDERNVYLAHSIYNWAERSEPNMAPSKIVAIVGIGHVKGMVENWGRTTEEEFRELKELPVPSKTRRVVTKTIKYCTIAMVVYIGYRTLTPSSIQEAVQKRILG